ncbi:hypothetical protein DL766_008221 [Monosporascus sp. MC13-8B]|uniref:Celp0028 effector like protein n=1 Tax=Monosporascus cannonballus TaxID=155416 RepID=A0ABY0HJM7_9PEZI|nr:hypothetical protein DL763_010529 [Monosporascus cannonballus]RYO92094.1 hypothetical protein DL762_001829 [Monosporascus cannonballus]RYP20338.1 hypothetical protein DL766_008221 [Monosporascus sp. MC13-8B]
MFTRQLSVGLAVLAASSHATPAPQPLDSLLSAGTVLKPDDIIIVGADQSVHIMKDYEYDQLDSATKSATSHATMPESGVVAARDVLRQSRPRGCEESDEIQLLSDETFLNWDVAVSPVVSAAGGTTSVSLTKGHSISNSLSVGVGASLGIVESILSLSFSVDYSQSWTTQSTQSFTFAVPAGQFGVVVTQAKTRRRTGNYLSGCTDNWKKTSFVSDTYTSQSYGNMEWVQGVIRLCNSTTYPVPYCIGTGSHY